MTISLVVLQGPSASGKSTIQSRLGFPRIVTWTSRSPRESEREGIDYFFKSREEMRRLFEQGRMVEMTEYHGNLYGTPLEHVENAARGRDVRSVILDEAGAAKIKRSFRDRTLLIGVKASREECERRLSARGHAAGEIAARLSTFEAEIAALAECDLILNNSDDNREKIDFLAELVRRGAELRDGPLR